MRREASSIRKRTAHPGAKQRRKDGREGDREWPAAFGRTGTSLGDRGAALPLPGPLRYSRFPSPDPQPSAPSSPIRSSLQVQQSSVNLMHSAGGGDRRQPAGHRRAGAGPASSPAAGPGRREAGSAGPEPSASLRVRRCRRAALPRRAWGHRLHEAAA